MGWLPVGTLPFASSSYYNLWRRLVGEPMGRGTSYLSRALVSLSTAS